MTEFTQYEAATGIIYSIRSPRPKVIPDGMAIIEGRYSPLEYRIVNGQPEPIPSEELEVKELERAWFDLRCRRQNILQKTDWTQVPDAPVDSAAWATYRQQLRDLPANTTDPRDVTWPVPPS